MEESLSSIIRSQPFSKKRGIIASIKSSKWLKRTRLKCITKPVHRSNYLKNSNGNYQIAIPAGEHQQSQNPK